MEKQEATTEQNPVDLSPSRGVQPAPTTTHLSLCENSLNTNTSVYSTPCLLAPSSSPWEIKVFPGLWVPKHRPKWPKHQIINEEITLL